LIGNREYLSNYDRRDLASRYGPRPVAITDQAFSELILAQFDTDGNGILDTLEATFIEVIETPGTGEIQSLAGIEAMTGLVRLISRNESLTSLPPLPVTLTELDVTGNPLTAEVCDVIAAAMAAVPAAHAVLDQSCFGGEPVPDERFDPTFLAWLCARFDLDEL